MRTFKRPFILSYASLFPAFLLFIISSAHADYYPNSGSLFYDGEFFLASSFTWSSPGPWTNTSFAEPGYEHDFHVQDPNFFTTTCTSTTNLPDSYDDCPTAGVLEQNGPVYSFGSYDATKILANTVYVGSWSFSTHGAPQTSPMTLSGQETENVCFGFDVIWCRFAIRTFDMLTGYSVNWMGLPIAINW